ncbi:MAG: radical SAM family heme chaperone HemW [Gammaproteobacteria bacterium]|nr:MAG: radical SAM family heme chaperone HemW [Gammaproteobacteria bacterium]
MSIFLTPPPLSLYVHFPWCIRKCPYCDFNSHELKSSLPEQDYINALIRDLEQDLPRVWGRRVQTVYMGGGTPSLFSPTAIAQLLSDLRARLTIAPDAEITLEANPGTVDIERFQGFKEAGINRLSIGIQSFNNEHLQALGRIHSGDEARRAVQAAQYAGFERINLDLMFGLPNQTLEQARADLATAIELEPGHLSLYQLTIEPNTLFHARPPVLPDDDSLWDMQQALQQQLAGAGHEQYEVSAYAQAGQQSRHNLNYWQFGDYLGIGAGAHAKLSDHEGIGRLWKIKHPHKYLEHAGSKQGIGGESILNPNDVSLEFMMNALRLSEGVPTALFPERAGQPLSKVSVALEKAETLALIEWDVRHIKPTVRGRRYLNDLLQLFMS